MQAREGTGREAGRKGEREGKGAEGREGKKDVLSNRTILN